LSKAVAGLLINLVDKIARLRQAQPDNIHIEIYKAPVYLFLLFTSIHLAVA